MADLPEGLLDAVKSYLNITWQETATDTKITGYINRGMARLQKIAGVPSTLPRKSSLGRCCWTTAVMPIRKRWKYSSKTLWRSCWT